MGNILQRAQHIVSTQPTAAVISVILLQVIDVWDEGSGSSEEDMLLLQPWWRSRGGLHLGGVSQLPSEQLEGELAVRSQCGVPAILQTQERELWVQGLGS